ncbi:hypothetical protein ES706_01377 [subsurface metagenome]|nr:hypothetical protein [Dehalococcoidia bacterium]
MKHNQQRNTNILLIGTALSYNQGTAAQALSAYRSLKEFNPSSRFTLISPYPSSDSKQCAKYGINMINGSLARLLFHFPSILREYKRADVIISLHGDSYSDDYHAFDIPWLPSSFLPWAQIFWGILLRKPVVIYPQSIGPFKTRLTRFLARVALNKTRVIMARGQITYEYLRGIGIDEARMHLVVDSAFLLEPSPPERVEEILSTENINKNTAPLIGMSISQSIIQFSGFKERGERRGSYITLMAQVVDYLVNKLDATIVFVPSVIGPSKELDDRIIGHEVFSKVKHKDRVIKITNEYTPEEFRGVVGHCDLFIGARMHANIAALSMHVPTIAIGFSHKTPEIMMSVGQDKYICDIKGVTFEELVSKIDDAWHNREKIREDLESSVKVMRENLISTIGLIKQLLSD